MSWDQLVNRAENILTLVALLAAIWSAFAFVQKIGVERENNRLAKVKKWRKSTVQEILHHSPEYMTAVELTDKLKSSSFDAHFDINKSELNEQEVRLLLIDMIADGILIQIYGDLYGLNQYRRDITVNAVVDTILANHAFRAAFSLILKHSGQYNDQRLWTELGAESGLKESDFILAMSELSSRNVAEKDENGKWHPRSVHISQLRITEHA